MTTLPPMSPGETLDALIRQEGLNQTEAAAKVGVTRQYINSVSRGKLPFTTELKWKLKPILRKDLAFWDEVQSKYDEYLTTPEGMRHVMASREQDLADKLDIHGQHTLLNFELRQVIDAGVIRLDVPNGKGFRDSFDEEKLRATCYTLALGPDATIWSLDGEVRAYESFGSVTLQRGEIGSFRSEEIVRMGSRIRCHIHGTSTELADQLVHTVGHNLVEPWNDSPITCRLINHGPAPVRLERGQAFIEVSFEYLAQEPQREAKA